MSRSPSRTWSSSSAGTGPSIRIDHGRTLVGAAFEDVSIRLEYGAITRVDDGAAARLTLDARGLLVLPGAIDIHGDGFERLVSPRPSVSFQPEIALIEADRQFIANGITTAYHALTWSWEGGKRGEGPARAVIESLTRLRPHLMADTRMHLRHETYNLDAEATIMGWIDAGLVDCLAFNDHLAGTIRERHRPDKMRGMVERSGLSEDDFHALVERVAAREAEVPQSIARLAGAGLARGLPMLSHDDMTPAMRDGYRALGCQIAEFPINEETTKAARTAGDHIVFGAPNVIRGGSHTGCPSAGEMARLDLCSVLASDYYYPALPHAPFVLAERDGMPLEQAWRLVSRGPALALGLRDRGEIKEGRRADIVLIEPRGELPPRIIATIVAGTIAHLADATRLRA
jgi:alpha-D-ribose 1-methylphosphonate 5-triphosphate diphosphatase